eukprot:TRINITY_DN28740_c0_g1_i1.p1 TRINITY_DN28740_c0_g1~~TRINITY_DN28740_c0_g1_i1.p1  ORF type:complete len:731 (+),score=132.28 TRINITY_DN28740_c0_g1_i1:41-2233(+)
MALVPRPYQQHCIDCACDRNIIAVLPTNAGKTLIAVKTIDHFHRKFPRKCAILAVPTKALVKQQAIYCKTHCEGGPEAAQLCGMEMEGWDASKWRACRRTYRILVGTPEIFRRALEKGFLQQNDISLLILDECHNAVGNSPMARIMKENLSKSQTDVRILGLTASFVSGAVKKSSDVEIKKIELELLLHAKMVCSDVAAAGEVLLSMDKKKEWHQVSCPIESLEEVFAAAIEEYLSELISECDPCGRLSDISKGLRRLRHVFAELGMRGFTHAMQKTIIHQLNSQAHDLAVHPNIGSQAKAAALRKQLPVLQGKLAARADPASTHAGFANAPPLSGKLKVLLRLLQETLMPLGKGIVFVTQVILTVPLAHLLQANIKDCKAVGIYGQMPLADQNSAIQRFKQGELRVLVSTDTLQEGIDVPDCEWVVRFNEFTTTKSHIQGSGRARSLAAQVYYFKNDPDFEQERASLMKKVAGDQNVGVTEEIQEARDKKRRRREEAARGIHPFEEPDCSPINFFNGLEIMYHWCQQTLFQNFAPENLYHYAPEAQGGGLVGVRVPWPTGFTTVMADEIDRYWGEIKVQDIIEASCLRKYSPKDIERRKALFVIAVKMRKKGYLDNRNEPTGMSLALARSLCEVEARPATLRIRNTFPRDNPRVQGGNFVSALNEWAQRQWPTKVSSDLVTYLERHGDDGWVSTVQIVMNDLSFTGVASVNKKAAQQLAARKAFECLST